MCVCVCVCIYVCSLMLSLIMNSSSVLTVFSLQKFVYFLALLLIVFAWCGYSSSCFVTHLYLIHNESGFFLKKKKKGVYSNIFHPASHFYLYLECLKSFTSTFRIKPTTFSILSHLIFLKTCLLLK